MIQHIFNSFSFVNNFDILLCQFIVFPDSKMEYGYYEQNINLQAQRTHFNDYVSSDCCRCNCLVQGSKRQAQTFAQTFVIFLVCTQFPGIQMTQGMVAMLVYSTKERNYNSIVIIHQHCGYDVTCNFSTKN